MATVKFRRALYLLIFIFMTTNSLSSQPTPKRFLSLGDSYTYGESIDPNDRWPVQTVKLLRENGTPFEDPVIIARSGWTTRDLLDALEQAQPKGPFDVVTLLIGTNNQFQGRSIEEYRKEFKEVLTKAISFAGGKPGRVIVLSMPDWSVTPYANRYDRAPISRDIDRFNAVNKEEATHANVRYIDINPGSKKAGNSPDLIAEDGLHFSGKLYAEWAKIVAAAVQK